MDMKKKKLLRDLERMAPWHFDIPLTDDIRTRAGNEGHTPGKGEENIVCITTEFMQNLLQKIYPSGLAGQRLIDAACNAGGYCFLAHELGADYAFGFDVREHWIRQAKYLQEYFNIGRRKVHFRHLDLYDLNTVRSKPFNIAIFKGIFYHLPYPLYGFKLLADKVSDLIYFETEGVTDASEGTLKMMMETDSHLMSGVYRMAWWPSSPEVVESILKYFGFNETRVVFARNSKKYPRQRIGVIGARTAELLTNYDNMSANTSTT